MTGELSWLSATNGWLWFGDQPSRQELSRVYVLRALACASHKVLSILWWKFTIQTRILGDSINFRALQARP